MPSFLQLDTEVTSVSPDVVAEISGLPITNTLLMAVFIAVVFGLFGFVVKRFSLIPGWFQNATEILYEQMYKLVYQITGEKKLADNIFPLVGALFVYIGAANLFGLIPGLTSFTYDGTPIFRTPTTDINLTLGLAAAMLLLIQVRSIQDWGFFGYVGRFIRVKEVAHGFRKGMKEGFLALVDFFVGLLDIIAEAAKVISLSFRLFGNMFAGEVLAVLLLGAFAYAVPSLWLSINLLFAVVQAVVFGALVAAYYTLAMKQDEVERNTTETGE